MQIVYKETQSLVEYENNTRTHSGEQVEQIAASIKEFGFVNPVLIDGNDQLIAGHGRLKAALGLGLEQVPAIVLDHLSPEQARALVIADNKIAENAGWDEDMLAVELQALAGTDFDLSLLGFDADDLAAYFEADEPERFADPDAVPEVAEVPISRVGDVWQLGAHRVMCGDSTNIKDLEKLMAGDKADIIHADPPYGMGKESVGVENDNLYREKLDKFQMSWWRAVRPSVADNGSVYIWGNSPGLWRLWYRHLEQTEHLELRNQIVWDKKSVPGMKMKERYQYSPVTENCLFIQIGHQFIDNVNSDNFPEAWEPIRSYLADEAKAVGLKAKDVQKITGCQMYSHWFTKSQFTLITEEHYKKIQEHYSANFKKAWKELNKEWQKVKIGSRSYFDNTHDIMTDVWDYPRVVGADRHGHATPKPVAMMERVMRTSCPSGGLCVEPFGGSGSTLMGAENTGRRCFTMELQPKFVDVIVRRWQTYTGGEAIREADGLTFSEVSAND